MRIECVNVVADESSTAYTTAQSVGGIGGNVSVAENTLKLAAKKAGSKN